MKQKKTPKFLDLRQMLQVFTPNEIPSYTSLKRRFGAKLAQKVWGACVGSEFFSIEFNVGGKLWFADKVEWMKRNGMLAPPDMVDARHNIIPSVGREALACLLNGALNQRNATMGDHVETYFKEMHLDTDGTTPNAADVGPVVAPPDTYGLNPLTSPTVGHEDPAATGLYTRATWVGSWTGTAAIPGTQNVRALCIMNNAGPENDWTSVNYPDQYGTCWARSLSGPWPMADGVRLDLTAKSAPNFT